MDSCDWEEEVTYHYDTWSSGDLAGSPSNERCTSAVMIYVPEVTSEADCGKLTTGVLCMTSSVETVISDVDVVLVLSWL